MSMLIFTLLVQLVPIFVAINKVHSRTKQVIAINISTFLIGIAFTFIYFDQIMQSGEPPLIGTAIWGIGWLTSLGLCFTKNTTPQEIIAAKKNKKISGGTVLGRIIGVFVLYFIIKSFASPAILPNNTSPSNQLAYEFGSSIGMFGVLFIVGFFISMWDCRKPDQTIAESLPGCSNKALKYTIVLCIITLFIGANTPQ